MKTHFPPNCENNQAYIENMSLCFSDPKVRTGIKNNMFFIKIYAGDSLTTRLNLWGSMGGGMLAILILTLSQICQ